MGVDLADSTPRPAENDPSTKGASIEPRMLAKWRGDDRYRIRRRIGEGGMGVVYEAFDVERGQPIALKSLLHFTPAALYRFKQEFRTLTDVHHPNLVRLYELVVTEGEGVFFTMELIHGTDFLTHVQKPGWVQGPSAHSRITSLARRRLAQPTTKSAPGELLDAPDPPSTAVAPPTTSPAQLDKLRGALRQLVEGVRAIHAAGKLHRDIKPSNVLVTADGRVVILDFGVATQLSRVIDHNLSEGHEFVGTVCYMAPEQALEGALTPASDWYSVGVVLYEALVGKPPFSGPAIDVITMKALGDPVPPAECVEGVPEDLDALCRALLDREPEKRPTGLEILKRLGASQSVRPIPSVLPVADLSKASALVGREQQLQALRDAFDHVLAGHSSTVHIAGASGMGKSAVAQHFLDALVERGEAVVLRGRAYERESVPYKAVDSIIDALSRYLIHLEDGVSPVELPSDIGALARVFPVLRRVPAIGALPQEELTDPQLLRRRAFGALRELIGSLAKRRPLVVYVDDVQWGDTDSAALLLELMRPPAAPPVLFVMTHRDGEQASGPFLTEMRNRWPEGAAAREVTVGPLGVADAHRLALTLLTTSDELAQRTANAVARESAGSPFLIEELVRSNVSTLGRPDGATLAILTLDQMVAQRLERLPDHVRLLLEIVAVGGRPLPVSIVALASGIGEAVEEAIAVARARRFVRAGLRDGREFVESSHDRFRETIVGLLPAEKLRERHARLASALEAAPESDAEAVAMHLLGAGENIRAATYLERAADEAVTKLAFDQAARLFRLTLEQTPTSSEEARRLRRRLAEALEWAGRGEQAARVYLEAAEGAAPLERAELEREAAVELFASGRLDEGAGVLRRVLDAVGLEAPRSAVSAVFWLLVYRLRLAWLLLFNWPFEEREPSDVPRLQSARVEAVFAASIGFAFTNVILGTCMAARSLVMARKVGDRFQLLRAAIVEASQHAAMGGKQGSLERTLVSISGRLAERDGTVLAVSFYQGNLGISVYLRGQWKQALEMLDGATSIRTHDHRWGWQSHAKVFSCWALNFLGEHRELARRHALLLADAEQRGDRYMSVQLRAGSLAILWLAADDPEGARRNAQEAIALWPRDRYLLQHWHMLYGEAEIELYAGDARKAHARVERDKRALQKSLLLHVQHMRVQTAFLRARCATASFHADPSVQPERLREMQRLARQLEREGAVWSAPFAAIVRAAIADARHHASQAITELRSAIDLAKAADMSGYATAVRYQLGSLLGGDEGRELVGQATEAMMAQGVRVPERFAATLVPGRWRSE
jgi:serine/threonine protein kinase